MAASGETHADYALRRTDRGIDESGALDILRRCDWGVLSVVGADGAPYGVPLNYALQESGGGWRLVFHCAREGRKLDALRAQAEGSFVVVENARTLPDKLSTAYSSVVVSGPVAIVDEPEEKRDLLRCLVRRFAPDFMERGEKHIEHRLKDCLALRLEIRSVCGKGRKFEES